MLLKNEASVIRSIKNLLNTNKYERLFQPSLGSNIRNFLFENITPQTALALKNDIISTIENYEPRARIIEVIVDSLPDKNAYVVTITFYVANITTPVTIQVPLVKVR
jgi:phage baseplate assembly protein W